MADTKYHNNVDALVWLDTSAEQDALYRQAFAWAAWRVESELAVLRDSGETVQPCVFSDCDETLLDNSEFNSWLVITGRNFHTSNWDRYCNAKRSRACAGAVQFVQKLTALGVQLFYVTSRSNGTRPATAENLKSLGFPIQPDDATSEITQTRLFMADMNHPAGTSEKWTKWDQYEWIRVNRQVRPLLWLGDNLSDFERPYKNDRWEKRLIRAGKENKDDWGRKYIVMPNPVYGAWLANYRSKATDAPLIDDAAAATASPDPVRAPVTPLEAPKVSELEVWPPPN